MDILFADSVKTLFFLKKFKTHSIMTEIEKWIDI